MPKVTQPVCREHGCPTDLPSSPVHPRVGEDAGRNEAGSASISGLSGSSPLFLGDGCSLGEQVGVPHQEASPPNLVEVTHFQEPLGSQPWPRGKSPPRPHTLVDSAPPSPAPRSAEASSYPLLSLCEPLDGREGALATVGFCPTPQNSSPMVGSSSSLLPPPVPTAAPSFPSINSDS